MATINLQCNSPSQIHSSIHYTQVLVTVSSCLEDWKLSIELGAMIICMYALKVKTFVKMILNGMTHNYLPCLFG